MHYTLKIFTAEEVSDDERALTIQRFRVALETSLGDASLVVPVYRAYLRLLHVHNDHPRPWPLTADEQLLSEQWEAAEFAAHRAAFGPENYMGEARIELGI